MCADVDARDGQLNGLVQVWTWGEYGFHSVFVTILDAQGEVIESDYAVKDEGLLNYWAYIFEFEDEDDRSLTVQVVAMDYLGGLRIQTDTVPVLRSKKDFPYST